MRDTQLDLLSLLNDKLDAGQSCDINTEDLPDNVVFITDFKKKKNSESYKEFLKRCYSKIGLSDQNEA